MGENQLQPPDLIDFYDTALERADDLIKQIDIQSNMIIFVSLGLFAFTWNRYSIVGNHLYLLILGLVCSFSATLALMSVHPPRSMRKKGQEESLIYNKKVTGFLDGPEYFQAVRDEIKTNSDVAKQFATETFNLYKYVYQPKRWLFKLSRNVLLWGISISIIIFAFQG